MNDGPDNGTARSGGCAAISAFYTCCRCRCCHCYLQRAVRFFALSSVSARSHRRRCVVVSGGGIRHHHCCHFVRTDPLFALFPLHFGLLFRFILFVFVLSACVPLSPPSLPLSLFLYVFFFALFSPSCLLIYSITVSLLARGHELSASLTVSCAECVFVCVCAECICG